MSRSITFTEKWGNESWKVSYSGPYENSREKHVEVGSGNMDNYNAGDSFSLSKLHVHGNAVMWNVNGCKNGRHTAHFTVYYGSDAAKRINSFK
jgi:hypothetical protein